MTVCSENTLSNLGKGAPGSDDACCLQSRPERAVPTSYPVTAATPSEQAVGGGRHTVASPVSPKAVSLLAKLWSQISMHSVCVCVCVCDSESVCVLMCIPGAAYPTALSRSQASPVPGQWPPDTQPALLLGRTVEGYLGITQLSSCHMRQGCSYHASLPGRTLGTRVSRLGSQPWGKGRS